MDFFSLIPAFVLVAVVLVVVFSELVKKLDKKKKLKGFYVFLPVIFSAIFAFLLLVGKFFAWQEVWFWWACIFGVSVFFYEAIIKRVQGFMNANEKDN